MLGELLEKFRKLQIFTENYSYDLAGALAEHPIKELQDPEKTDALMHSLEKGNIQAVTFEKDGTDVRMFIEANPQYKDIKL